VEAAQNAPGRTRMIVLDEDDVYPVFVKALMGIALEEKATLVLKEICIYNQWALDLDFRDAYVRRHRAGSFIFPDFVVPDVVALETLDE
jgi:hypothetical protein